MTAWRTAWRSLRSAAGLDHVRFHDGRHTALTRLAEGGEPDWVIQAQMGHVSPQMMKTYSHIRRVALDKAAVTLEPTFKLEFPENEENKPRNEHGRFVVRSQCMAQSPCEMVETFKFTEEIGSSGWIRTESRRARSACRAVDGRQAGETNFERSEKLAPRAGFEPATLRLTAGCSAVELPRNTERGELHSERAFTRGRNNHY